jgi:hypothetical protein
MPEDRDQLFERALARHLHAEGAGESLCLDPETLAAYHERMLSPEELSSAKSHIVSCARCQEVLAQLEATQEVSELQDAIEAVPGMGVVSAASASAKDHGKNVFRSAELGQAAASSKKVLAIPAKRYSSLRWSAPAGAIAAALLIWIGVRESNMRTMPPVPSAQVAENRQLSPPSSSTAKRSNEVAVAKDLEKQKSEGDSADQLKEAMRDSPAAVPPASLRDEKDDFAIDEKLEAERKKPSTGYEHPARAGTGMVAGRGPSAAAAQAQANNALQRGDQAVIEGAAPMRKAAPQPPPDLDKAEPQKAQPTPGANAAVSGLAGRPAAPPPPRSVPSRTTGRLRGTVTDPSGAAIAGANVVLRSAGGSTVASTSTDGSGKYSFGDVAEGNYQLELQSAGFKTDVFSGVKVAAGENVRNAKLEVGTATETVEVVTQAPVIGSQAAEVEAKATPVFGRNYQALTLASSGLQAVASPDGKVVWKFGEMGQIVHSTNAGKDWTAQTSGVTAKLLAGAAPSAQVCWIAGAAGTLLRTTNGGRHWQRITVPITGDLSGVHASDDKHASIWDASKRASYETSDGGKTWKQTANE